jgi:hypothetical protein
MEAIMAAARVQNNPTEATMYGGIKHEIMYDVKQESVDGHDSLFKISSGLEGIKTELVVS